MLKYNLFGVLLCLPLATGLLLQSGSCHDSKSNKNSTNMNQTQNSNATVAKKMKGEWGGQGILLVVNDSGATVEFDCATGRITEEIVPDASGKFSVKGLFARQRPGPTREGEENDGQPATYAGVIEDDKLTLTVTLVQNNETVGTFALGHGKTPRIRKCG